MESSAEDKTAGVDPADTRPLALIVNTHARRGQKALAQAEKLLREAGFAVDAFSLNDPDALDATVAEALDKGHRLVVLGGGDGTISSAIGAFANRDVVLGVLPLGTANSFAKSLGMPLELEDAVAVLAKGNVSTIDLGRIGDRYFANVLSIGLQTAIAQSVSPSLKKVLGRGGYMIAAAKELFRFRSFGCRLVLDGERETAFDAVLEIRIANGPFKGGMLAAPEADLRSGDLVIHVVKGSSAVTLGRAWGKIAFGGKPAPAIMESLRAASLRLETKPPQDVSVDGEVAAKTPITVTAAPKALKVIVGRMPG